MLNEDKIKPLSDSELDQIQKIFVKKDSTSDSTSSFIKYVRPLVFVFVMLAVTAPFLFIQNQMMSVDNDSTTLPVKSYLIKDMEKEIQLDGLVLKTDDTDVFKIVQDDKGSSELIYSSKIDLGMMVGNRVVIKGYRKMQKPANVEMVEVISVQFK